MLGRDYRSVGHPASRIWNVGRQGKGEGQFGTPVDISISPRGDIAVVDQLNHRVQFLTSTGQFGPIAGQKGSGWNDLKNPAGLAYSNEGQLAVCDSSNHRIQIYVSYSEMVDENLGEKGQKANQCNSPNGVEWAWDSLLIADTGNHRLLVWSRSAVGLHPVKYGSRGSDPGQFNFPVDVAFFEQALAGTDSRDFCPSWFVGNLNRSRCASALEGCEPGSFLVRDVNMDHMSIVWCDQDFKETGEIKETVVKIVGKRFNIQAQNGGRWVGYNTLHELLVAQPNLQMPPDRRRRGIIAVSDQSNHRVQILFFIPPFSLLVPAIMEAKQIVGDETYPIAGRLKNPSKLTFNSEGDLIVSDTGNRRIVIYSSDCSFLHSFGEDECLPAPFCVACDSRDNLCIGTRDSNVVKYPGPQKQRCGNFAKYPRKCASLIFQYLYYWEAGELAACCSFLCHEMAAMRVRWELAPLSPLDLSRLKLSFQRWACLADGTSLPPYEPVDDHGKKICDKFLSTKKCDRIICPYAHAIPCLNEEEMEESEAILEFQYGIYHVILEVMGSIFWWDNEIHLKNLFFHYSELRVLKFYIDPMTKAAEVIRTIEDRQAKVLTYSGYLKFMTTVFEHVLGLRDWKDSQALAGKQIVANPSTDLEYSIVINSTFDYQVDKACQALEALF